MNYILRLICLIDVLRVRRVMKFETFFAANSGKNSFKFEDDEMNITVQSFNFLRIFEKYASFLGVATVIRDSVPVWHCVPTSVSNHKQKLPVW